MFDFSNMSEREIIARTAWAEADELGVIGMQATVNTGQNRVNSGVKRFGDNLGGVFSWPWQYSCWNANNKRLPDILSVTDDNELYAAALDLADEAIAGNLPDITNGATHYFNHLIVRSYPASYEGHNLFVIEPHWYYRAKPY